MEIRGLLRKPTSIARTCRRFGDIFSCQSNERQLDLNNLYIVGQFGAGSTLCFFLSSVFLSLSNIFAFDRKYWLCGYTMWKSRFIDMAIHWQGDHLVRAAELEKKASFREMALRRVLSFRPTNEKL